MNLCETNRFTCGRSPSYVSVGTYRVGQTTYLGSPKTSDSLVIIYDIQSERFSTSKSFDASHFPRWVRLEIRFVRTIALEMTMTMPKAIINLIDILKGY